MSPLSSLRVRPEAPADREAIRDVVRRAFGADRVAELVELIRASESYVPELALVAEEDGAIVGHVMLSRVQLDDGGAVHEALTLSPVTVAPEAQGRGVGSALIRHALATADVRGEPLVVLEGIPAYYPRFGFRPAAELGVSIRLPDWAPPEAAMAIPLSAYRPEIRGRLVYPPAFDVVAHDRT